MDHLFVGQIIHSKAIDEFEIFTHGFLAVQNGKVGTNTIISGALLTSDYLQILKIGQYEDLAEWKLTNPSFSGRTVQLTSSQFLMPGLIDCHIHASQMPNIGLGLDMELLDWLNTYTFPMEMQFKNNAYAQHVYEKVIVSCGLWLYIVLQLLFPETNTG